MQPNNAVVFTIAD